MSRKSRQKILFGPTLSFGQELYFNVSTCLRCWLGSHNKTARSQRKDITSLNKYKSYGHKEDKTTTSSICFFFCGKCKLSLMPIALFQAK